MRMPKTVLLVDYENVSKLDLSGLPDSLRAIVYVGAKQDPPKAARKPSTAHRFARVEFQKVAGSGGNALDFYIACELGRIFETARDTVCIVLSRDKGFDPLLQHLAANGLPCRRIEDLAGLREESVVSIDEPDTTGSIFNVTEPDPSLLVCSRCRKASTIEHYGGRWCTNCGHFASPPDPSLLPSNQLGYQHRERDIFEEREDRRSLVTCGWCHQGSDMAFGIYDDGEWMCGDCISKYADSDGEW